MTIEALWAVDFHNQMGLGSGVVIFETSRIFGGDSGWYYTGRYEVSGDKIRASVLVKHYGAELETVTGHFPGQTFELEVVGLFEANDRIEAHAEVVDDRSRQLKISMRRLDDLP